MTRLVRDRKGGAAVEFALVAPVFLIFLFFILEGGRMVFTRQGLNELATAAARCAALKATGCTTSSEVQDWAVARAIARSNIRLTTAQITIDQSTTCHGRTGMAKATLALPYNSTAMALLPRTAALSTMTAIACFPVKV